jgi:uncharacterized protein
MGEPAGRERLNTPGAARCYDRPVADDSSSEWQRLPIAASYVRQIGGAVLGLIAGLGSGVAVTQLIDPWSIRLAVLVPAIPLLAMAGAWLGRARWRRTRWKLDVRGFHVRRGWLWRTEILIPRTRVQHLDIERGPLERHFGLATLIVHTAGSQTAALQQSGLADADAVALRDALIPAASRDGDAL